MLLIVGGNIDLAPKDMVWELCQGMRAQGVGQSRECSGHASHGAMTIQHAERKKREHIAMSMHRVLIASTHILELLACMIQ